MLLLVDEAAKPFGKICFEVVETKDKDGVVDDNGTESGVGDVVDDDIFDEEKEEGGFSGNEDDD